MRAWFLPCAAVLLAAASPAPSVEGAWVRASLPHQNDTAAYLTIESPVGDTLLSVSTPEAGMAMLHTTVTHGAMSGMADMDHVSLPPGKKVRFAPHGMHVMLMDLKHPLSPGGTLPLTLHFAHAGDITIAAPVRRTAP